MGVVTWIAQVLAAGLFGMSGFFKAFKGEEVRKDLPWAQKGLPYEPYVELIGIAEFAAALGFILPMLTGIFPVLTPLAALGTMIIMVTAFTTVNFPTGNAMGMALDVIGFLLSFAVFYGRFYLFTGGHKKPKSD